MKMTPWRLTVQKNTIPPALRQLEDIDGGATALPRNESPRLFPPPTLRQRLPSRVGSKQANLIYAEHTLCGCNSDVMYPRTLCTMTHHYESSL